MLAQVLEATGALSSQLQSLRLPAEVEISQDPHLIICRLSGLLDPGYCFCCFFFKEWHSPPQWPDQPTWAYFLLYLNTKRLVLQLGNPKTTQPLLSMPVFCVQLCETYNELIWTGLHSGPNVVYFPWLKPLHSLSSSWSLMDKGPHMCKQKSGTRTCLPQTVNMDTRSSPLKAPACLYSLFK